MQRLLRITVWLLAIAIVLLSIVPAHMRPVTAPQDFEHFTVFLIFGFIVGIAYSGRYAAPVVMLLAFTALVEIAQLGVPGRHARLEDFLVDALGCLVGLGVASVARFLIDRHAQKSSPATLGGSRQSCREAKP